LITPDLDGLRRQRRRCQQACRQQRADEFAEHFVPPRCGAGTSYHVRSTRDRSTPEWGIMVAEGASIQMVFKMPERASIRASPQLARLPICCSGLRAIDLGNASA